MKNRFFLFFFLISLQISLYSNTADIYLTETSNIFKPSYIQGIWKENCNENISSSTNIGFEGTAWFGVLSFLIGSDVTDITLYLVLDKADSDNIVQLTYNYLRLPHNKNLNWDDFSLDSIIAEVKYYKDEKLSFEWFGFYNEKTQKREFLQNPFDATKNPVFLKKCLN